MKDSQHILNIRIIIVGRDQAHVSELNGILTGLGCCSVTAFPAIDNVFKITNEIRPELVIVDVSCMSEPDALVAVERVHVELDIPSVFAVDANWSLSLQLGGEIKPYGYLIKPFCRLQVATALASALDRHQTEIRLRQNETRLELALSGGELGIWDYSMETGRAFVNQRLADMLGYNAEEVGSDINFWRNLVPPEDLVRAQEAMEAHLEGCTQCYELEHRVKSKSGNWRWVLSRGKVGLRDSQGNPLRVTGTFLDITDRRLIENITRAQRDLSVGLGSASTRQEALQLCIDAALQISGMDAAGIYLANRDGGLDLAAHRGLTEEFVKHVAHRGPDTPQVKEVAKGKPVYYEGHEVLSTSPELAKFEGLRSLAVIPMLFDGFLEGCLNVASHQFDSVHYSIRNSLETIASDVTGAIRRLAAEDQVGRIAAQFRELADLLPQTVFETDATGRVTFINSYGLKAWGWTANDVAAGLCAQDHIVPEQQGLVLETVSKILKGEMILGTEFLALRTDGTTFPVAVYANPISREGKIEGIRGVCADIAELKEAQERIEDSLREKEVLLREIHHRVKNNLQVMSSLLRLQARYAKSDDSKELFRDAENRIRSMALVHEKLYASNYFSRLNIAEYVNSLVNSLKTAYGIGKSAVVFEQHVGDIELDLDTAIPVGFIVTELISNCLKHAFPGGRSGKILIALCSIAENRLQLTVKDDGVGMTKSYDTDSPSSFGLHLVQLLTEQMDGDIEIETGKGTEFRITFKEILKGGKRPVRHEKSELV